MAHPYDVGTKAWQPDATEGWVASEVTEKKVQGDSVELVFALENGEVCQHRLEKAMDCRVLTLADQNLRDDPRRPPRREQHQ